MNASEVTPAELARIRAALDEHATQTAQLRRELDDIAAALAAQRPAEPVEVAAR